MFLAGHVCAGVYNVTTADVNKYDNVFCARLYYAMDRAAAYTCVAARVSFVVCFRPRTCDGFNGFTAQTDSHQHHLPALHFLFV